MLTKTIQAHHLHVGNTIVNGGDGVRRTRHRIQELRVTRTEVTAVVRSGEKFETLPPFDPRTPVRIIKEKT